MKIKIIIFSAMLFLFTLISPQKIVAQDATVNFQVFYDELSPYGTWVNNPQYGYVWMPNVAPGFEPYATNGHWTLTDEGWTWVSDYPWGWAPFHYGRWYDDPSYGEMWVPDNQWGPGWVTWGSSDGYYGWAPIEPGISLGVAYGDGYRPRSDHWTFVRDRDFGGRDINAHYINRSENVTIINNTRSINNSRTDNSRHSTYNAGPERADVEKRAGRSIAPVALKDRSSKGETEGNGELSIYRPRVENTVVGGHKPAPAKVVEMKDAKPAAGRKPENKTATKQTIQPAQHSQVSAQQHNQAVKQHTPAPQQKQQAVQPKRQQQTPPVHQAQQNHPAPAPQSQHNNPPARQTPPQPQHNNPPARQAAPQHNNPPARQAPPQPQHNNQPERQAPPEQHNEQPAHEQPTQAPQEEKHER